VQALAAVLGGTQSLHTNGYDEALTLPSEPAATIALRTQQILAHESGVPATADPLGGSYYVEHLTSELETRAMELLGRVDAMGGAAKAIGASFFQEEIARSAYEQQKSVERGDTVIVGVNKFTDDTQVADVPAPDYSRLEKEQVARVRAVREKRDANELSKAVDSLARAADLFTAPAEIQRRSLVPAIVEAVRARASVGEIASVLRSRWGQYRPGMSS
jgi:methylmalonyl-CoA mutase N-terminal domain/subunit